MLESPLHANEQRLALVLRQGWVNIIDIKIVRISTALAARLAPIADQHIRCPVGRMRIWRLWLGHEGQ